MKWIAILAAVTGTVYLLATKKGRQIAGEITGLVQEGKELKGYLGSIASDIKQQGLQYGEQPGPLRAG